MALSIKNPQTEEMARELARLTGVGVTAAVTAALAEKLERVAPLPDRHDRVLAELRQISAEAAGRWPVELRSADHADLLYDHRGLPA